MPFFRRGHFLAACSVALAFPLLPARAMPPLSAYGSTPSISKVAISPDGARFAALVGDEDTTEVQIRAIPGNALISSTRTGKAKVRSLQWAGPDHMLATVSTTALVIGLSGPRREWSAMTDFSLKENRWKATLGNVEGGMNVILGSPTPIDQKGRPQLIAPGLTFPHGTGVLTLLRVNLESGLTRVSEAGNENTNDWLVGADGKAVARVDYDQQSGEWALFLRRDGGNFHRAYTETALLDHPGLVSFGKDADSVLIETHKSGIWTTHAIAFADNSMSDPLPDLDGDGIITDPATNFYIGSVDSTLDDVQYSFLSESDQRIWNGVRKAFPGELVTLKSWSDDRMTIIVEVEGATNGDAFYIVDRKAKAARYLADRYKGVEPEDLGKVETLTYKAADGTDIPAYLTLPPVAGASPKGLPLVVLPHGGPESRDSPGFDWWAQALASRGYAVLQPQFRGSSGFGTPFRDAGFGQWGRRMQTDLSDGVRFLAKGGTIDPKRVCIVGASYGGYAALAGVTLDPGVYRCASAVAGVADLRRMLQTEVRDTGSSRNNTLRYWKKFMGASSPDDKSIDAWSPARLADKVTVPVQLVHGKDDTVVLYEQSQLMEKALKAAGKPVEFVTLPGEDHWLSRAATRIQMLEAVVSFVQRNNPATPFKTAPAQKAP